MQATVRVELFDASERDYEQLHLQMKARGLSKFIKAASGDVYRLPPAEYDYSGPKSNREILNLAEQAVQTTGRKAAVLVTEAVSRVWSGLDKAHALSLLMG